MTTSTTSKTGAVAAPRALRADAARNREKLIDVAVVAFTEHGVDVPLESIAARAGVGVGTLYRHFPSRNALVQAVYRHEVERLCASPAALLAGHASDVALQEWMGRFVEYAATKRGMSEALSSAVASGLPLFANTRSQMLSALSQLIDAAVADGSIRADADPEDVLRAMGGVWQMSDGPQWREQARRLLALLMDGLRYGAPRANG
jgi:AcrR family transcriptional regulator